MVRECQARLGRPQRSADRSWTGGGKLSARGSLPPC